MNRIKCFIVIGVVTLFSSQAGLAQERPTAQDWFQRGVEFEKQGVYEEAVKMHTAAVESDRNYSEAYFRRAKAYMASQKTFAMEALSDFNRSIDLNPTNAEAYYERGLLHAFILNIEKAYSDMRTAVNLGHKGAQLWLAPLPPEKSSEPESTGRVAAVTGRENTYPSLAAGDGDKSHKRASMDLGQYLSSRDEPIVHFDFNRATIKERYRPLLDEIATVFKVKIPEAKIRLAGHTDSTGTERYNDGLSLQRARAVESYLTGKHGISSERITAEGYGESAPIATNETTEGQAKNRRTELRAE